MFDENGCLIASDFGYETYFPDSLSVEQNPEDYWQAVTISTRRLIEKSGFDSDEIAVVSFRTTDGCFADWCRREALHRILIWADRRGVKRSIGLKKELMKTKFIKLPDTD